MAALKNKELKHRLSQCYRALAMYAKRSTWTIGLAGNAYASSLERPWSHAATALGIKANGRPPADTDVADRVMDLQLELDGEVP